MTLSEREVEKELKRLMSIPTVQNLHDENRKLTRYLWAMILISTAQSIVLIWEALA